MDPVHTHTRGIAKGLVVVLLGWMLLGTAPAVAEDTPTAAGEISTLDTPVFRIPMTKTAPTIDGVMQEGEWEDASALSGVWYDWYLSDYRFMASHHTQYQVYGCYDKENLYIAFNSPVYPKDSWFKARGRFPDVIFHPQYGLIWDDHIEFELRPYHDVVKGFRMGLFKWFVNAIGTMTDQHWSQKWGEGMGHQSKAKVASDFAQERWYVEMAIPLSELRHEDYAGADDSGQPLVPLPPPDGTAYRVWFVRGLGGNGAFHNVWDTHGWNTTKTKMILDSKTVSFQLNELGPIMEDVIDVQLTVKNHNTRSETVRLGFFVESAEGTIYSSYDSEEIPDGLVELVPGEVRKIHLSRKFPGITEEGNVLWFDVRSAGKPAKPLYRSRLTKFHSMEGGKVAWGEHDWISYRYRRIDVLERLRPPRRDFDFWYSYSAYENRMSAIVDKGIHGASDEAKTAVEAKFTVFTDDAEQRTIAENTVPFHHDHAAFLFDMPRMDSGSYKVNVLLFDRNKRVVGETNPEPFAVHHGRYEWVKNDEGKGDTVWAPFTPMALRDDAPFEKGKFETLKHVFTLDPSGLPAQIEIKPHLRDLPLHKRSAPDKVTEGELLEIGRGKQLREPLRLEAVVDGKRVAARVVEPARLVRQWKSELEYASKLQVGPLGVTLDLQYDCDGAMHVKLTYGSDKPVTVESLELVGDFAGQFDLVATAHHEGMSQAMGGTDIPDCRLRQGEGVVWDSGDIGAPELYYSLFVPYITFGSGDRAFSWVADSDEHWTIARDASTMSLERDKAGLVTWRTKFVNAPTPISGSKTVEFLILTHPAKPKPDGYRKEGWFQRGDFFAFGQGLDWPSRMGTDEEIIAQWRRASGAPDDVPEDARATYSKPTPPWRCWYQLRGLTPMIPAIADNALSGDLFGRMKKAEIEVTTKRVGRDGVEREVTSNPAGGACTLGRAWEDLFVWHFGRQAKLARRNGCWWDETWPGYRSDNLAAGEAHLRNPADVQPGELPYQEHYLTLRMRSMFKRLARVYAETGLFNYNKTWASAAATVFESGTYHSIMTEACSSDHASFELDNVVVYPASQFTLNAHNYTGHVVRLVSRHGDRNSHASRPGDDKRLDRQMLGRGLLNDVAVQFFGPHGWLQHKEQILRVINGLIDFGFFAEDGQTEYIPYWRSGKYVRYGDAFDDEGAFELTESNPNEKVYVSVYRRPHYDKSGKKLLGYKAMFVIMNENDAPVRSRLFVLDTQRLFGGKNCAMGNEWVKGYDWSKIQALNEGEGLTEPPDWSAEKVSHRTDGKLAFLIDFEDGGLVKAEQNPVRDGTEIYGPIFIGPHDYRIVWAWCDKK